MEKIGIFGGTFDPPHIGHLIIAKFAQDELELSKVIFVPTGTPPHRTPTTPADIRLEMVKLAVDREFEVSDFEVKKEGVSWTYETILYFRSTFPKSRLFLIVGEDEVRNFHTWKNPKIILENCTVAWYPRFSDNSETLNILNEKFGSMSKNFLMLKAPKIEISSTLIRERVRQGKSIRFLVPQKVENFIAEKNLYI